MSWAAGFVDAMSWILLMHVYSSHMTGNTASFAVHWSQGPLADAFKHAWPIVPFMVGLIASAVSTAAARRSGFHSSFSIALVGEIVLLGLFMWLGIRYGIAGGGQAESAGVYYGLMCLPAAAMGLQTVTVTRVHGLRVYTTYLTGSLAKFGESVAQYIFWFYERTRGRFSKRAGKALAVSPRLKYVKHAAVTGGLWFGFFVGALCGAIAEQGLGVVALAFPMLVLAFATTVDILRPVCAAGEPVETDSAH
jgi:uncharacterized membrane protein YoaK (UPF0700 family)